MMQRDSIDNEQKTAHNASGQLSDTLEGQTTPNASKAIAEHPEQTAVKPVAPEVVKPGRVRVHFTDETLLEVLRASGGYRSVAADKLGVRPSTISKRLAKNPLLKEAVHDAEIRLVDMAQNELAKKVKSGNLTAIIFALKSKGGWVETSRVEMAADEEHPPINFVLPPPSAIRAAQEAKRQISAQDLTGETP